MMTKMNRVPYARQSPVRAECQDTQRAHSPLALLAAQIVLRNHAKKKMHARLRPEIEFILQTDLPREHSEEGARAYQIEY